MQFRDLILQGLDCSRLSSELTHHEREHPRVCAVPRRLGLRERIEELPQRTLDANDQRADPGSPRSDRNLAEVVRRVQMAEIRRDGVLQREPGQPLGLTPRPIACGRAKPRRDQGAACVLIALWCSRIDRVWPLAHQRAILAS